VDKLIVNDVITERRPAQPSNTPAMPDTAAAPQPPHLPFDLPTDTAGIQAYVLDYFKDLGVPLEEATPLLNQILTESKKRCEAILFFLSLTGAWVRSAEWLTLAIQAAALEAYIWNQRDSLVQRFSKNRRYRQDAEDIAHNVIAQAIAAIRRGRRPKTILRNWLSVIARNALTDYHRRESGQPLTMCLLQADEETDDSPPFSSPVQTLPDPAPSPFDQTFTRITWEELASRFGKQIALACRYLADGYKQNEIAEMCGVNEKTIGRWVVWLEEKAPGLKEMFEATLDVHSHRLRTVRIHRPVEMK